VTAQPIVTAQEYRRMGGTKHAALYCTKCAKRNPSVWCWDMEQPYTNCCQAPIVIGFPLSHLEPQPGVAS